MANNVKQPPKGASPSPAEAKKPAAPAPAPGDARPRAQVAYEGDDEFSVMSTHMNRRRKPTVELAPDRPDSKSPPVKNEADPPAKATAWHFIRKIFGS